MYVLMGIDFCARTFIICVARFRSKPNTMSEYSLNKVNGQKCAGVSEAGGAGSAQGGAGGPSLGVSDSYRNFSQHRRRGTS